MKGVWGHKVICGAIANERQR